MGNICPKVVNTPQNKNIYEVKIEKQPKKKTDQRIPVSTNENTGISSLQIIFGENKNKQDPQKAIFDKPEKQFQEIVNEAQILGQALYSVTSDNMEKDKFHKYIGALLSRHPMSKSKECKGTACLISSNLILTAAHNIFDVINNVQTTDHKFYLGVNGIMGKCYQCQSYFYPLDFQLLQTAECDYAIIKLKQRVTEVQDPNFLLLGFNFKDMNASLSIFGYPGGKDNYIGVNKDGTIRQAFQRGLQRKDRIKNIQNNIISYDISTLPGISGAPIITGKNIIIGVHKGSVKQNKQTYNHGRYVNIDMILRIEIWRQTCKGDPFKVNNLQKNQEIDLSSPLFQELKEMVIQEQIKSNRIKKMYKRIAFSKDDQLEKLRDKIQKFGGIQNFNTRQLISENDSLRQKLKQSIMDLKDTVDEVKELKKVKQNLQKQLSSTRYQLQQMIKQSVNEEKFKKELQNLRKNIIQFQNQIKTKDQQLKNKQEVIANSRKKQELLRNQLIRKANNSKSNGELIQWDKKSKNASKFTISGQKITLKQNGKYQITNLKPLPKSEKTILNFKILHYGGKQDLCIGILCQSRKESAFSGFHVGSVGYFSRTKNEGFGFIFSGEQIISKQNEELFIPGGGQLEMTINLVTYEISYTNVLKGKFFKFPLGKEFQQQQVYVFCNMTDKNTSIEVI